MKNKIFGKWTSRPARLSPLAAAVSVICLSASLQVNAESVSHSRAPIQPAINSHIVATGISGQALIPSSNVNPSVTRPEEVLKFSVGERTATPEQLETLVNQWKDQSDRVLYQEYARSEEGRPLHLLTISSPKNLANIAEYQRQVQQLANPSTLNEKDAEKIISKLPAVAWLGYSIHGNESSGVDSAIALAYRLLASNDSDTQKLLDNTIILLDPMMNPDGRARFTKILQEKRGAAPNYDNQSLLHTGVWPFGRTNHYYYDMNRDFYFLQAPETRGRVKLINQWYPQLMVDAHEMGALDTYLFAPAREPINKNLPEYKLKYNQTFAQDQANAFDSKGWKYYTGEWFENLFPGYSNYAEYRGAIHILYEQARTAEDGVALANGTKRTYRDSVEHQLVSSLSNLTTLMKHSKDLYRQFYQDRKMLLSDNSPYAKRTFVILPTENHQRSSRFLALLEQQGIQVQQLTKSIRVNKGINQLGKNVAGKTIPVGSLIIRAKQPEARLLNAIMEFDPVIEDKVLQEEWQRTLRDGSSLMYDNTAWSLPMLYGLDAWQLDEDISKNLRPVEPHAIAEKALDPNAVAWRISGADDASLGVAAKLMANNIKVRALEKAEHVEDQQWQPGSIVVLKADNADNPQLMQQLESVRAQLNVEISAVASGLGNNGNPDLGGSHYALLQTLNIAVVADGNIDMGEFGAIWHMLDKNLGIPHSHLHRHRLAYSDLRRYNVLIVPNGVGKIEAPLKAKLQEWMNQGGTLIATGNSAQSFIDAELSSVSTLENSLEQAEQFNLSLQREWLSQQGSLPNKASIWAHQVPTQLTQPWKADKENKAWSQEDYQLWYEWSSQFMPSGALLAGRLDSKHWLTYGVSQPLPLLMSSGPLLMSDDSSEAAVRVGTYLADEKAESKRLVWAMTPEKHSLHVRMSGLLWPEAAQLFSNTAYVTREGVGKGQMILFAQPPMQRGATLGTSRLLLNAIVLGPGFGASAPIEL